MVDRRTAQTALLGKLRDLSVRDAREIELKTEIFYDLNISGDDLDELIEWIFEEFDVDFSRMNGKYGAGEAEIFPLLIYKLFGWRPYKSITVGRLLDAIEHKRW